MTGESRRYKTLTRNVCVKVLDGTESFTWENTYKVFRLIPSPRMADYVSSQFSTHFIYKSYQASLTEDGFGYIYANSHFIAMHQFDNDLAGFKAWLAEQYAAGTPVTIYYPLATPATETVDIEKPKTLRGNNTVTIGTEVRPTGLSGVYKSYSR